MLVQTLQRLLRAVTAAVEGATGAPAQVGKVLHEEGRGLDLPLVAAAHYAAGPVRRLVVACEPGLAAAMAARRPDPELPSSRGRDPARGLTLLGGDLQTALAAELGAGMGTERFLVHDPAGFRPAAMGPRSFRVEWRVPDGRLELLADLDARGRPGRPVPEGEAGQDGAESAVPAVAGTIDAAERRRLLSELARVGADVQVHFRAPDGETAQRQGTILGAARPPAAPGLLMTCTCLADPAGTPDRGEGLTVVFELEGRLLQFESPLLGIRALRLPAGSTLPLLHLGVPERLVPGQRRRSRRVRPDTRIEGSIRSLRPGFPPHGIPCVVRDLSHGGVRLALTAPGILSAFRWGSPVSCRLELPGTERPLELVGRIRRVDLSRSGVDLRDAELGVEFDLGREENEAPLKRLADFVASQGAVGASR